MRPELWWELPGSPMRRRDWLETGGCASGETRCAAVSGGVVCVKFG